MIFFAQATNQRIQLGTDAAYRGRVMALFVARLPRHHAVRRAGDRRG